MRSYVVDCQTLLYEGASNIYCGRININNFLYEVFKTQRRLHMANEDNFMRKQTSGKSLNVVIVTYVLIPCYLKITENWIQIGVAIGWVLTQTKPTSHPIK